MKTPVSDTAVAEFARRICAGVPTHDLFPDRMSNCAFSEAQREVIRRARSDLRASRKKAIAPPPKVAQNAKPVADPVPAPVASPKEPQKPKVRAKLTNMLFRQGGRCFFCGEPLKVEDASIEHLNPISRGGTRTDENEVVCHALSNAAFANMSLKEKFVMVLNSPRPFRCLKE
jgi:5-methylcytosine-specific restriction endonuclease McrA